MLSKGMGHITLEGLCSFLNKNGFQPSRKDIEAILRRCDHDANQNISFQEFAELVGCRPIGQTYDQIEYKNVEKTPDTRGIREITEKEKQFPRVNSQEDLLKGDLSAKKTDNPIRVTSRRDLPQDNWEDQYDNIEDLPMKHRFLNLIVQ